MRNTDDTTLIINGQPIDDAFAPSVSVFDRLVQFGDGVFETMVYTRGRLELWAYHMDRLRLGCKRLAIPTPDEEMLKDSVRKAIAIQGESTASRVVKIIISRGASLRGYVADPDSQVNCIVLGFASDLAARSHSDNGIALTLCEHRMADRSSLGEIKHCNRLDQIVARLEWRDLNYDEGVIRDFSGNLISGTMTNIFIICDGKLVTPEIKQTAGVAGTVRRAILQYADENDIVTEVSRVDLRTVMNANEMFVTNSLWLIAPVKTLQNKSFAFPGEATKTLTENFYPWLENNDLNLLL